jgi:hypothetical protein
MNNKEDIKNLIKPNKNEYHVFIDDKKRMISFIL